ncbi:hypothetical protein H2200_010053 [Cladophialophora chaetospira]|uniref:DUF7703 domain-containing protein n=1 Tax=Cladophialophora chaetospira TaxID=386627 RepID=A0AA38X232_9EURO|nr:hypothetical protein H2200_010053 [Cladophialophora chaetospira]
MSGNTTSITTSAAVGVSGGYEGDSFALKALIAFFAGLTIYNSVELIVLIFATFHTYSGVYFWSLLVANLGLIPYALGFLFKLFEVLVGDAKWVSLVLLTIGWYAMVTGQSVVLWSRLHLLVVGETGGRILNYSRWMIIVDAVILHIPTSVVTFGSNGSLATDRFVGAYNIIEKFQMAGFFVQEVILSLIYIIEAVRILQTSFQAHTSRRLIHQLILVQVVILVMDIALLSLECASLFLLETILKGFIYSVKLKLEFVILGRLVTFVRGDEAHRPSQTPRSRSIALNQDGLRKSLGGHSEEVEDIQEFVDVNKLGYDPSHAIPEISARPHRKADPDDLEAIMRT